MTKDFRNDDVPFSALRVKRHRFPEPLHPEGYKRQCCATKEDERNVKELIRVPCCYCSFSFSKSACCDISHCCVSTKMLHLRQKKS